ncbi:MAG: hypothetical protein QXQ33_00590 [Nitrososphaerota archaeon]
MSETRKKPKGVFIRVPRECIDDIIDATQSSSAAEAIYKLSSDLYAIVKTYYENKDILDQLNEIRFTFTDEEEWRGFRSIIFRMLGGLTRAVKTWVEESDIYLLALYGEEAQKEYIRKKRLAELEKLLINLVKSSIKYLEHRERGG